MTSLTWSLVIATYKRPHILARCLRLATAQTCLPQAMIVVDASPDWQASRDRVQQELASYAPTIPLIYVKAYRPSLPAQRNQGIDLARSDVVFLLDDDSLMYPTCAEEIMKIYEADPEEHIQGVSAIAVPVAPDQRIMCPNIPDSRLTAQPRQTWLRRWAKDLLKTEQTYFLPYDRTYPSHPLPPQVPRQDIGRLQVMAGCGMTFRRRVLAQERFNDLLDRYAVGDDQDLSYRVSRYGAIVNAVKAHLCHLEAPSSQVSRFQMAVLAALNPAVLQQFHSLDRAETNHAWQQIVRQRLVINLLKDLCDRDWSFARTRGNWWALSYLPSIHRRSLDDLSTWYAAFQQQLWADPQAATVTRRPNTRIQLPA